MTLSDLVRRAETGEQWAHICRIEQQSIDLAARRGYPAPRPDQVNLADDGSLASVECGCDEDGMSCFVLNFDLS
jgi:hypothetical protein